MNVLRQQTPLLMTYYWP